MHPGLDDAHHHRRDRRGRLDEASTGGALGRRRAILWAWVLTIPAAAIVAAVFFAVTHAIVVALAEPGRVARPLLLARPRREHAARGVLVLAAR